MSRFRVTVSLRARQDANRIYEWIAERSPQGADRWYEEFLKTLRRLESNAELGMAAESSVIPEEVRQVLFKTRKGRTYRALFTLDGTDVQVLCVRGPGQPFVNPSDT